MSGSEDLSQNRSRRVVDVFCGSEKGYWLMLGEPLHLPEEAGLWLGLQLLHIAATELLEPSRLVSIPFAKFGARSNFLDPLIVKKALLGDPSWPQSIHQNSEAVLRIGILVYPSNLQAHPRLSPLPV